MLTVGQPIVTIVDLNDTWVRAAVPETESDHIGLGDARASACPFLVSGKVFFVRRGGFATQRDVSRRKRDIRTIVLKVRLGIPKARTFPA